jgi:outer membrane protein OmpU
MYKRLLASTALVAAGVVGVSAGAQAQTAPAAAPLSVTVGGYVEQFFAYGKNKDGVTGAVTPTGDILGTTAVQTFAKPNRWYQNSDSEIFFNVKGTLANGITVGARVELEGNTESDTIDESYTFIEGAFGRLELGSTDEAAAKTHVSVPGIGKAWGVEKGTAQDFMIRPAQVRAGRGGNRFTGANGNEDQQNVSYYTPRFEGFQVGATYTANRIQDVDTQADKAAVRNGGMGIGLNFTRNFSGFNVEASAAYTTIDGLDNAAVPSANNDKEKIWTGGLRLGYAGFQVGGAYKKLKYGSISEDTGKVWAVGAAYTFGPATVGVQYMKALNEGQTTTAADDKFTHLNFGANYTLGPGVDLFGNIFSLKYTDESSSAAADNNKGSGAAVGLRLTF